MDETQPANLLGRHDFADWEKAIQKNCYSHDADFIHTMQFTFPSDFRRINPELEAFGARVTTELERLVTENNLAINLPRLNYYDAIGRNDNHVIHHPDYIAAGNIIYGTKLLARMAEWGGLTECLAFLFLSAETGEAGHNCPIACSAGIIRVLKKVDVKNKGYFLEKLIAPSFSTNFTGAQFLTEVQGGSDVGLNATYAVKDSDDAYKIFGEKWFCSNANADLLFVTARYDKDTPGTKGLGLFLIPAQWDKQKNHYTIRRLKEKIGTRSMATGEIDFHGAKAWLLGEAKEGIHLVMDNVLHLSRLFNTICVLGMARRAYAIASEYAKHRIAFGQPIANYPLVKENLAKIKAENAAMVAAVFATAKLQDRLDTQNENGEAKLLLRLLVNMQKYLSAKWSVEHIHHCLDVLAGNGTIETFSSIPRLLRDAIVCENWEGTHNVLRAQITKDILKYDIDKIYLDYMKTEIQKLSDKKWIDFFNDQLESLKQYVEQWRKKSAEIQSLEIRIVVDKMAILFCALMLLKEALNQQELNNSDKKMLYLTYFIRLHLEENSVLFDNNYIKLITKIIAD